MEEIIFYAKALLESMIDDESGEYEHFPNEDYVIELDRLIKEYELKK